MRPVALSVGAGAGRRLRAAARRPPSCLTYYYIHTEGVRPRPANGGGGIQGRRMHCMRWNTPISIPNVALRGIANCMKTNFMTLLAAVKLRVALLKLAGPTCLNSVFCEFSRVGARRVRPSGGREPSCGGRSPTHDENHLKEPRQRRTRCALIRNRSNGHSDE